MSSVIRSSNLVSLDRLRLAMVRNEHTARRAGEQVPQGQESPTRETLLGAPGSLRR